MTFELTNRPFPDDAGDRHVLYADDGQVIATWYEPHPDLAQRIRQVKRRPIRTIPLHLTALLTLLAFLTGLSV